jgi:Family of unknown function (DUF6152)
MKSNLLVAFVASLCFLSLCGAVMAHHGNAAYADKVTEFKNVTITKFSWANPHTLIYFDVKDAKGNVVNWTCESAAPQALRLIGWSKTSLGPGDVINITMYAAKNGNPAGRLNKIVLADGTELHDTQLGGDGGGKTRYDPDAEPKKK